MYDVSSDISKAMHVGPVACSSDNGGTETCTRVTRLFINASLRNRRLSGRHDCLAAERQPSSSYRLEGFRVRATYKSSMSLTNDISLLHHVSVLLPLKWHPTAPRTIKYTVHIQIFSIAALIMLVHFHEGLECKVQCDSPPPSPAGSLLRNSTTE